jgi:hypothetical protein
MLSAIETTSSEGDKEGLLMVHDSSLKRRPLI